MGTITSKGRELRCVSVSIVGFGEYNRWETAAMRLLEGAEERGRASIESYTCEGTPEQCRANPDQTLIVAALTRREYDRLLRLEEKSSRVSVEIIDFDQDAEGQQWNGAIYYCGRVAELPAFAD